ETWRDTRQGVSADVRNVSEKDLAFRPHPESRSFVELVHHVIESGLMMSGELYGPDGGVQRKSSEGFLKKYGPEVSSKRSKRDLLESLKRTHRDGEKQIRQAGELHMLQLIRRFDGKRGTRLAWMNHGISHEEYHRGQLALYARLLGRVAGLTRLILGV